MKNTPENKYYYDARGATVMVTLNNNRRTIQHLDGEGKAVRQDQYSFYSYQYNLQQSEYFIYSSVLGKLLTEVNSDGTKKRTFVYGMSGVVALQQYSGSSQEVRWEHTDPSNASYIQTGTNGLMYYVDSPAELDPLGSNVGLSNPYNQTNSPQNLGAGGWGYGSWGDPFGGYSCMVDWISQPCSVAAGYLSAGIGEIGPLDPIAAWQQWRRSDGSTFWRAAFWERGANGQLGYYSYGNMNHNDPNDGVIRIYTDLVWHPFGDFESSWLSITGFTDVQTTRILDQIIYILDSKDCLNALKDARLRSPNDFSFGKQLKIFNGELIFSPNNNSITGGDVYRKSMVGVSDKHPNANDITDSNPHNGNYYMAIMPRALNKPDGTLESIVVHAIVHSLGGVGKEDKITEHYYFPPDRVGSVMTPGGYGAITRPPKHDLEWMNFNGNGANNYTEKYDAIIKNCVKK